MRRAVLVILDGLRRDMISAQHTPNLASLAEQATAFANHHSVFPSVTRVCAASVATGCLPSRHGLAGNTLALSEGGRLVVHDAGHPDFLQHKRRVTGRSLAVPTLAERVAGRGGAIVFSNVSPGAAYAHDPDGQGYVYHRDGSFGPGRIALPQSESLTVAPDIDGDRAMTERFVGEVLGERKPALAVLWLGHPDSTQHYVELGSPEHLQALKAADAHAGKVIDAVEALRRAGEDNLLLVGSDHGHQTVTGAVDIADALIGAGLKQSAESQEVVVAPSGKAALIYLPDQNPDRMAGIAAFLKRKDWTDKVVLADELVTLGHSQRDGLAIAVSMRSDDKPNAYGVPGKAVVAAPRGTKDPGIGFGQHGGLGAREQAPFLMIAGEGFEAGSTHVARTSLVDIAPTVLTHLGLLAEGHDGRALQSHNDKKRIKPSMTEQETAS